MKGSHFFALTAMVSAAFAGITSAGAEDWKPEVASIELPPASIARWYKPQNKRQVWLHAMFGLRTELGAIELYLDRGESAGLSKWANALQERYGEIPEMVPEWKEEVDLAVARALYDAAVAGDMESVRKNAERLEQTCERCHERWAASTAALYRSPDFSQLKVKNSRSGEEEGYAEAMREVSRSIVEIKVFRADGDLKTARSAVGDLEAQLRDLGENCGECHRDTMSKERFLGAETLANLKALRSSLTDPHDPKRSGQSLGKLGAGVCGGCHGVHRTLSDLRNRLAP